MERFIYPVMLTPQPEEGGFTVRFIDYPEAITQGESIFETLHEAVDCLEEAVANRIVLGLDIPTPSPVLSPNHGVSLTAPMAAKAALYLSMRELKLSEADLAAKLDCPEQTVRSLFDPHHKTDMSRIENALLAMGRQMFVGLQTVPVG